MVFPHDLSIGKIMRYAYKIFEVTDDYDAKPRTLFHGLNGSRTLTLNEWLEAEVKVVSDGGRTKYLSGFHAYPSIDAVKQWFETAKKITGRVVCKVQIAGFEDKPYAVRPTFLASRMRIPRRDWEQRILAFKLVGG